jgi:hypothetical protein
MVQIFEAGRNPQIISSVENSLRLVLTRDMRSLKLTSNGAENNQLGKLAEIDEQNHQKPVYL